MHMKKFGALTLAAVTACATLGFAQTLGSYPQPFITNAGGDNFLVVVGEQAATSDVVGAINLAARLGGETGTDVAVGGSITKTVSGEGRALFTDNEKIFLDDNLKKTGLRTVLAENDLPTILKSGQVEDGDKGETYDYDQFIDFHNLYNLTFNKISGDLPEPNYLFGELTTSPTTTRYFVRTRVVFNDDVDTVTAVNEDIELFGATYTISSETTPNTDLVLFGSSETRVMQEGEEVVVNIGGTDYTIKLIVVSDADTVGIGIGSDSRTVDKGQTRKIGGVDVFVDEVFYSSKDTGISSATIGLGARTLTLVDGSSAKVDSGSGDKTVDGTHVDLVWSSGNLTGIDLYFGGLDSNSDFLTPGTDWMDPVWGTFRLSFDSVSEDMMAETRDLLEIRPSGTKDTELVFTNDRGDRGTIKFAHLSGSGVPTPALQDDNGDDIVVVEGMPVQKNDFFIVDAGDFSRIFELTSASSLGSADAELEIRDVMSGNSIEVKLGADNATSKVIDGQTYYFNASTAIDTETINLNVTWGASSSGTTIGTYRTVFPKLKTEMGAELALYETVTSLYVPNNTNIELPTGAITFVWNDSGAQATATLTGATTESGDSTTINTTTITDGATATTRVGKTSGGYALYAITSNGYESLTISVAEAASGTVNNTGVLLIEEEDDNSNLNVVAVRGGTELDGTSWETSPTVQYFSYVSKGTSGGTFGVSPDGDSDLTVYADYWGTYVEMNTDDQNWVKMYYPDSQVSAHVFVLGEDAVTSTGGSTGAVVRSSVPIKTPIAKLDSAVTSADRTTKNLILVGGPAINSLVSELGIAGKSKDLQYYRDQGAGYALIHLVNDAFATGKSALVIAGYDASDTLTVSNFMQNFDDHDSDFGTKAMAEYRNGVMTTTTA
jgi:hypothetical protein